MSVDLPDPDGPMIAVNDPGAKSAETPRSASTAAPPSPNRLVISLPRTTAVGVEFMRHRVANARDGEQSGMRP